VLIGAWEDGEWEVEVEGMVVSQRGKQRRKRGKSGQRKQAKGRFFFEDSLNCETIAIDLSLYAELL
jgi:hypothetical protein